MQDINKSLTTYPIPKSEHIVCINTERANTFGIRGKSCKMLRDGTFITVERIQYPFLGGTSIRHRFLCRKRFRRDEEQSRFGMTVFQNLGNVRSIDIGTKMHVQITFRVRFQRLANHNGT